jgi:aspartyl aminopeptidase
MSDDEEIIRDYQEYMNSQELKIALSSMALVFAFFIIDAAHCHGNDPDYQSYHDENLQPKFDPPPKHG